MGEEIELATKTLESVSALAEASGVLGPVRELANWVTSFIHYRRQPALAALMMRTAEKVMATGIPSHAVEDKLLRSILEGGSLEDDPDMRERWAGLLANALTADPASATPAFPQILAGLCPADAQLLDRIFRAAREIASPTIPWREALVELGPPEDRLLLGTADDRLLLSMENLERLGLCLPHRDASSRHWDNLTVVHLTTLGREFVLACGGPTPD